MLINISNMLTPVFYKLLYMSMIGSIIGIIILFITKVFDSKLTAKWKCFMWIIPIMFLMIPINRIQISTPKDITVTEIIDRVESSLNNVYTANENELAKTTNTNQNESSTKSVINSNKITVYNIIPIIWLIGATISMSIVIIGNINLKHRINKAKKVDDSGIKLLLMKCKRRLQITKKIEIRLQDFNTSPCIYGIFKPKILVSEEFIKNDSEVIENVFMHELSHYKRKDMISNTILLLMTALHWFNPFVYGFFKKIRQEMELATDEIALSRMDKEEKKQYGLTLISLLQTYETEKVATKILCITDDNKNMERRIEKIKLSTKLKKYRTSIILLIAVVILCIISPFVVKVNGNVISTEDEMLYNKVKQYLIKQEQDNHKIERKEIGINDDDFEVFIDMSRLGIEKHQDETYVYVWALIQTCYVQEGLVTSDERTMPYKFIIKNDEIVKYENPEDGEKYAKTLEKIFPKDIIKKIEESSKSFDTTKIENQIKEHYSYLDNPKATNTNYIDINAQSTNSENSNQFVGKWKPYKAKKDGNEITLNEIYGSGISAYGGELILNNDGTYTEFIGIYSEEIIDDLQGNYKMYTDGERALLTTKNGEAKTLELLKNNNVNGSENIAVLSKVDGTKIYFKK